MFDHNECIFCFESFSPKNNETCFFQTQVNEIQNKKLVLSCKHIYHLGCFITYIKTVYNSWKKHENVNLMSNFLISCPYCRSGIEENEIMSIILQFNDLKKIKVDLDKKISKLRVQIFLSKIKLYSRKILRLTNTPAEIFAYHRVIEEFEDWEFLNTKINYFTKDTDSLLDRITKRQNILCNFYEDDSDWF